jgi:2-keto-4-pentenoate hydratase/2-oxohepta-3-ene-1,7-dioic acid hydratase in catechol pathway
MMARATDAFSSFDPREVTMIVSRRVLPTIALLSVLAATALAMVAGAATMESQPAMVQQITHYVRYRYQGTVSFGILDGETVQPLDGDFLTGGRPSGPTVALADVELLAPVAPSKVIAVGLNYRSHIGDQDPAPYPGLFAKYPTSIVGPGADIVIPPDASNVHYEGELVVVIGKTAKNVAEQDAREYIFGVTAGNDVSERNWQRDDLQWLRAKGSDTFGPLGPAVVTGLDYNDLHVETRLNGDVRQAASTADLIFGVDTIVSYVSRYVTLYPGDIIFTGTPGSTRAMQPGDVVEIEVQGVGVLRNTVAAAQR